MKKLKALSIFIFVFGAFCLVFAVVQLFTLETNLRTWRLVQLAGRPMAQQISVEDLRASIIRHSIWFIGIGLLSTISGLGLFLLKEWARKLWLASLMLLSIITLYWFAFDCYLGRLLEPENLIGYPITFVLIISMWLYLTRQKTKHLLRRRASSFVTN
jgi:hypothetical protein